MNELNTLTTNLNNVPETHAAVIEEFTALTRNQKPTGENDPQHRESLVSIVERLHTVFKSRKELDITIADPAAEDNLKWKIISLIRRECLDFEAGRQENLEEIKPTTSTEDEYYERYKDPIVDRYQLAMLIDYEMGCNANIEVSEQHQLFWCFVRQTRLNATTVASLRWEHVKIKVSSQPGQFIAQVTVPSDILQKTYQGLGTEPLKFKFVSPEKDDLIFSVPHRLLVIAIRRGLPTDIKTLDDLMKCVNAEIKMPSQAHAQFIFVRSDMRWGGLMKERVVFWPNDVELTEYLSRQGYAIGFTRPVTFNSIMRRDFSDSFELSNRDVTMDKPNVHNSRLTAPETEMTKEQVHEYNETARRVMNALHGDTLVKTLWIYPVSSSETANICRLCIADHTVPEADHNLPYYNGPFKLKVFQNDHEFKKHINDTFHSMPYEWRRRAVRICYMLERQGIDVERAVPERDSGPQDSFCPYCCRRYRKFQEHIDHYWKDDKLKNPNRPSVQHHRKMMKIDGRNHPGYTGENPA